MRVRGFTTVEILLSAAIIGLLASVALPVAELAVQRKKEQELGRALREIRDGLNAYRRAVDEGRVYRSVETSGYPPSLSLLVDGVPDAKNSAGGKVYFLRRIPRDPMNVDPAVKADASWGLRSYESTAEDPRIGRDVYDVFSLSESTGLNGVPYRRW
jgi:general secretion pathway protein G